MVKDGIVRISADVTYVQFAVRVGTVNRVFRAIIDSIVDRDEAKRLIAESIGTVQFDLLHKELVIYTFRVSSDDFFEPLDRLIKTAVEQTEDEHIDFIISTKGISI